MEISVHEAGCQKLGLWDSLEGQRIEGGCRGIQDKGSHVYPWPIHFDVWQKPSQKYK